MIDGSEKRNGWLNFGVRFFLSQIIWIKPHQRKRRILVQSGLVGYFDAA